MNRDYWSSCPVIRFTQENVVQVMLCWASFKPQEGSFHILALGGQPPCKNSYYPKNWDLAKESVTRAQLDFRITMDLWLPCACHFLLSE